MKCKCGSQMSEINQVLYDCNACENAILTDDDGNQLFDYEKAWRDLKTEFEDRAGIPRARYNKDSYWNGKQAGYMKMLEKMEEIVNEQ